MSSLKKELKYTKHVNKQKKIVKDHLKIFLFFILTYFFLDYQDVYVVDPFEGPGFDHLTKSNK